MTFAPHTLALISIVGSAFDLLGAMYLAYDLLGGEHGPLRTLSRAVTYGTMFGAGYGVAGGPVFGLACGLAHGISLAWEFSRASRRLPNPGPRLIALMCAIRGAGFGIGSAWTLGWRFGLTFGLLITASQIVAYRMGITPTADYRPARRPRVTRFQLLTAALRTVGYGVAGYLSSLVGHLDHAITLGLRAGIAVGLVTAVLSAFFPFVEWAADHIPEKRMGVIGVGLILIGFALQSVQYWATLLDLTAK